MNVIGRKTEIEHLEKALQSNKPEFIAIYGRRRVGKTYLVREFCRKHKENFFYFECTGHKNASISTQIDNFCHQIEQAFSIKLKIARPNNWNETLRLLGEQLLLRKEKKILLFFDELPWLASTRSMFLESLDYNWNQHWSKDTRIKLITCGSAASWMHEKLILATGGLHNRVTKQMRLSPFRFSEIRDFSKYLKLQLIDSEILKLYLVFGGVPYYWSLMPMGKSAAEIIDILLFKKNGALQDEFEILFKSLFDEYQVYEKIVKALAKTNRGITRNDLLKAIGLKTGGTMNKYIKTLEMSGFIENYVPFGRVKKESYFRLIDEFCLFHLYWTSQKKTASKNWLNEQNNPAVNTWGGFAFENFCLQHKTEISRLLGIETLVTGVSSWRYKSEKKTINKGTQIDLIFERKDGPVNLIEIKYSKNEFKIDKSLAKELVTKKQIFIEKTKFKGQVFFNLVTASGFKKGLWDDEAVDQVVNVLEF